MNPLIIIAVPMGLLILGMILNSWDLGFNQPPSSTEQDAVKKLTAEKESYRKFFDLQRTRSTKRQKRVGHQNEFKVGVLREHSDGIASGGGRFRPITDSGEQGADILARRLASYHAPRI